MFKSRLSALLIFAATSGASCGIANAEKVHVFYAFQSGINDGYSPDSTLIRDRAGNFYGTTTSGGRSGDGTVFSVTAKGTERVIYSFGGGSDGALPMAGVVRDRSGNLYGTTFGGGGDGCEGLGCGAVFEVSAVGTETVLHVFSGGSDGSQPLAGLVRDGTGNLYGAALNGGANGYGVVFAIKPGGSETVLHAFAAGSDGAGPGAALLKDKAGNLYGTTLGGGAASSGTVFKIAPDGTESVLYSFKGGNDGAGPTSSLIEDAAGNFYGTTGSGGRHGTVFKLSPDGTETVLYAFKGGRDGSIPLAGVTADGTGDLYGTTNEGGACVNSYGCGVVFEIAADGTESILHRFSGGDDGASPGYGSLFLEKTGKLYGMTELAGAYGGGTIFELKQ